MSFAASLSDCARALDAAHRGDDAEVRGVGIDTRTLEPGALFVAVRGERLDGHDFAAEAARRGAAGLVVERPVEGLELPQLVVADTTRALGRLARYWLDRHPLPVIAITGSNGKTTVREICREILERLGPVLATRGNLNNDFGVPLTLLGLGPEHRYAVIEMGASRAGDIARLCEICPPDVAVVTHTAAAHLEGFGDLEGVARAKGEIYRALGPHGSAVVNADDPRASILLEAVGAARAAAGGAVLVRRFGTGEGADVRAVPGADLAIDTLGTTLFARFALLGDHNRLNALAAVAAVQCLDVQPPATVAGLEAVRAFPGRLQSLPGARGCRLIDDGYNANPASVRAAIDVLAPLPGRRHLVLGEMLELGEGAADMHAEIGRLARRHGLDRLWALGPAAARASGAFGAGGEAFDDVDALVDALLPTLGELDTVLVKGSRGARMERVVAALGAEAPAPAGDPPDAPSDVAPAPVPEPTPAPPSPRAEASRAAPAPSGSSGSSGSSGPVVPSGRLKRRRRGRSPSGAAS